MLRDAVERYVLQGRGGVACWFRGEVEVRLCKGETEAYIEVQGRDGRREELEVHIW